MNRSNAPSPIRTTATPTAAAAAAGGDGYYPSSNNGKVTREDVQDSNNNTNVASHEQRQQQQQQQPTLPSRVTFQPGITPPRTTASTTTTTTASAANINLPYSPQNMNTNFMFEEMEDVQHELFMSSQQQQQQHFNSNSNGLLPTEAQLTLLCLDYLRSLRRSYQNPQDLVNGEGLHADYISLAVWSLSRAFVSPDKLTFGEPKVSTIIEENGGSSSSSDGGGYGGKKGKKKSSSKKKKYKEIHIVGGGGLAGVEDKCVGNDSVYRLVQHCSGGDGDVDDDNMTTPTSKEVFALTDNIKLPSMEDITNEILLSYKNNDKATKSNIDNNNNNNKIDDDCPIYEQNDMHLSNSHRFYLFNGMASGDDCMGMAGGGGGGANANNGSGMVLSPKATGTSIVDGGPLTLTDLTSVALSTLNARSRIEAEREVVQDPLFGSFIKAAGEKGFFNEKKLVGEEELSPEEEKDRQRVLYENKYRKVVAKFRSKLAVREEQQMLHHNGGGAVNGGGGGWTPRSGQRALVNVHSVSDRLEMRRDRIIEQVKGYRVEEEEEDGPTPFMPHYLSSEQQQQPVGADVVAGYGQGIPQRYEYEEGIQDATVVERMTEEVERAPMDHPPQVAAQPPSPTRAPMDPPSPFVSPPSHYKPPMDPPPSPERAARVPPSPATNLPFYQEAERINSQGNELMQQKQFNQALELYTAALKISPAGPNSHVYYSNRAAAHLSLGDVEGSIQDSELALTIRPDYAKAHSRLGLAHYASGRYEEAVASYEAALDIEPDNEWVKNQYEKARKMIVKLQEQKEVEKKVLTEDKGGGDDWPSPFNNSTTPFDEEAKRKEAQDTVLQADAYKDNGNAFMKDKKYEEALHQYNLAIDTSPGGLNSHIYYSNRAAAYCYLGQYSEAADDCLSSIELNETYEKAYSRYGLSLFFLGDYEGSIDAYRKSLDLAPDNKASLSYLAKAKARLAERQENEIQEDMAKKLNLGKRQESLGVGNDELDQEIEQDEGSVVENTELSQSRDDEGEGVEASCGGVSPSGQAVKAFDPFDSDEGDEI